MEQLRKPKTLSCFDQLRERDADDDDKDNEEWRTVQSLDYKRIRMQSLGSVWRRVTTAPTVVEGTELQFGNFAPHT